MLRPILRHTRIITLEDVDLSPHSWLFWILVDIARVLKQEFCGHRANMIIKLTISTNHKVQNGTDLSSSQVDHMIH